MVEKKLYCTLPTYFRNLKFCTDINIYTNSSPLVLEHATT